MIAGDFKLAQLFEHHRHKPWIFVRPLGNWGDHLIFAGAECLANSKGLDWVSCETEEFESFVTTADHCVYLQGGGGYNSWGSGRAFVNLKLAVGRQVNLVVQGPITIEGDTKWLEMKMCSALSECKASRIVVFAREELTFAILSKMSLMDFRITVCIDHDTALVLDLQHLLEIAELSSMPKARYDLLVLRDDNEQPIASLASNQIQICPSLLSVISLDPAYVATSLAHWVKIHLLARSIVTNRLHSCIAGVIAKKPVTIAPGSYHKNHSVWRYSLKKQGVLWADPIDRSGQGLWPTLPTWLQKSHKANRLRWLLHGVPLS